MADTHNHKANGDGLIVDGDGVAGEPAASAPAGDWIKETNPQDFLQDVLEASMQAPVLVDFWGPSCAPCRQLTPLLEKAVARHQGAVRLVKMNVEAHPEVAQQLRITSIPAVMVFREGRPVDGFLGAVPESQVNELVNSLAGGAPAQPGVASVERGEEALAAGDAASAAAHFAEALQADPTSPRAIGGLAQAHVACGDLEKARHVLAMAQEGDSGHEAVLAARSALELAEKSATVAPLAEMQARLDADPNDHAARFDLALALHADGRRSDAVAQLLEIVARAPQWNEQAARRQLLQLFEAYGQADSVSIDGRKRLSALLFR